MNRRIILYAILLAVVAIVLKLMEYKFVVLDHAVELYVTIIALIFAAVGVVVGRKLTAKKEVIIEKEVPVFITTPEKTKNSFQVNEQALEKLGITRREYEILELMNRGLSNQEIADQMFLSVHTIKTHASNLFFKLDAKRRTQAVMKAKELQILP